jgi:post-segregation antitoxin (ccd killing protein)
MPYDADCISRRRMSYVAHIVKGMSKIAAIRDTAARARAPRTSTGGPVIPWYSSSMTAKRKVSVSLDEDLVTELEAADEALSGQVNEAIRAEVERRRRNRLLTGMLDALDAKYGPVDEALVAKYTELL